MITKVIDIEGEENGTLLEFEDGSSIVLNPSQKEEFDSWLHEQERIANYI